MEILLDIVIKWAIPFLLGTISTALISYVKSKYSKDRKKEQASNPKDGIKISSNAAYRSIVTIRRIFN